MQDCVPGKPSLWKRESLGASARAEVRKQIIQINAISPTERPARTSFKAKLVHWGKEVGSGDSRSDSF